MEGPALGSRQLWSLTMALAFLSVAGAAQQPNTMSAGSSAGISTITVRVTYQQNHWPAPALRVELLSPLGGMAGMRTTHGNGGATFDGVGTGRYQARVSRPNVETTTSETNDTGGGQGGPDSTQRI